MLCQGTEGGKMLSVGKGQGDCGLPGDTSRSHAYRQQVAPIVSALLTAAPPSLLPYSRQLCVTHMCILLIW